MTLAPIILFTYNRPIHSKLTVEALRQNFLAKESDLIVYSDGAKNLIDAPKVDEVRAYLRTLTPYFKSVEIINRERNYGLANSIIDGVTSVVNKYEKVIVLEDDLVSSPYFLMYMNEALNLYENKVDVISIHGYIYPLTENMEKAFFIKGADCWGWATWKRGWDIFNNDGLALLNELERKKLTKGFDFNGSYPYTKMLKDQIAGENNSWAIRWYASAFLANKLTLYPNKSYIQNIGNDSSGTHSKQTTHFNTDLNGEFSTDLITVEPIESTQGKALITAYYNNNKQGKLQWLAKKILLKK